MTRSILSYWPRLTRLPLALEIALAVLLKLAILFALWHAFFSRPQATHMLLPTSQVEQHLLAGAASASNGDPHMTNSAPSPPPPLPPAGEGSKVSRYATFTLTQPKAQHGSD
jgi:hypothetical protein